MLKRHVKKVPVVRMSFTYSVFALWPSFRAICCYHAGSEAAGKNYFGSATERERGDRTCAGWSFINRHAFDYSGRLSALVQDLNL